MNVQPDATAGKPDAPPETKRDRERSAIQFPYGDLDDAMALVRTVHQRSGQQCTVDQLAAWLGHASVESGGYRSKLATARVFSLVSTNRQTISLTPLGMQAVDPRREAQARVDAFLSVPLYKAIYDKYRGRLLPPDAGLEGEMVALGVATKQKDKARQAFQRSANQALLFSQGRDRLVLPPGAVNGEGHGRPSDPVPLDAQLSEPSQPPLAFSGSGRGPGRHPLIDGLFQTLPAAGARWSQEERKQWLQAADAIFGLVYKHGDQGA